MTISINGSVRSIKTDKDRDGRLWWVVILPMLGLILGSVITVAAWSSQLPSQVANQWAWGEGIVATVRPLWLSVIPLVLVATAFVFGILILEWTERLTSWGRRITIGALAGVAAFIAAAPLVLLIEQRGIQSAWDAPDPALGMMWLAIAAALYAVVAALVVGNKPLASDADRRDAIEYLPLADGEDAVWTRTTTAWVFVLLGVTGVILALVGLFAGTLWPVTLVGAVFVVFAVALARWTITVDKNGVRCTSFCGFARFHYPVVPDGAATATDVHGFGEFLGWGIRMGGNKSVGLIFRNGPALRVSESGGRSLTVTVNDATTAAALYNTQVARLTVDHN